MAETLSNMDRLPEVLRKPAEVYSGMIRQLAGTDALALVFYGLAVSGPFDAAGQQARNVLVLAQSNLDLLRQIAAHGAKMSRSGIAAPVVMTPTFIQESCDTFPLELLEIQQQHVLIFGEDHFAGLSLKDEHIRMQCERELKAALVGLQRGVLTSAGEKRLMHAVATDAAEGLARVLRGILWLRGEREPRPAGQVVGDVEQAVGRKLPGIAMALNASLRHGWETLLAIHDDITALGEIIDAW